MGHARNAITLLLSAALAGCASAPRIAIEPSPAPTEVGIDIQRFRDVPVSWAGMIVETRNFERHSEIETIAFPLDRSGRPIPTARDLGRFVAVEAGFLDPQLFAPGRFVTVTGRVTGERRGKIREAAYVWPEVDVEQLQLWREDLHAERPRVTFSIGVGIGR